MLHNFPGFTQAQTGTQITQLRALLFKNTLQIKIIIDYKLEPTKPIYQTLITEVLYNHCYKYLLKNLIIYI